MKFLKGKSYIIWLCIVLALLIVLGMSTVRALGTDTICGGVKAGGVSLGGLTKAEATDKLRQALKDASFDTPVQLTLGDLEKQVIPSDFLTAYDYEKTADAAITYAHEGNYFRRVGQAMRAVFIPKKIPMAISYDEETYANVIEELMDGVGEKVVDHTWEIEEDALLVTTGKPGLLPDAAAVTEAIFKTVRTGSYDEKIVFKKETRNPGPLSAEQISKAVCAKEQNASYVIENGKVIMHPHTLGISFDTAKAQEIIDAHPGYGVTFEIPLRIVEPEVMLEDIEAKLFAEVIGEHTTTYNTGDVSRSKNISLASHKINGTILAPDEVFSYNDVVGERSYSEGFETAHVYINGESVPGVGGGICQVSSTLFNAVIFANLDIVERVNHQLTVSYVPLGRDATVDYGNIDFRFRNTTGYPIKIVCSANGGKMYVGIYGYKADKSETVSFETVTIGHTPAPERKVEDPTLPKGEEKEEKPGSSGYIVDTYKIVKRDGREPEKVYICRSNYSGNLRIIHVGTGEAVPSPTPPEDLQETDTPSSIEETPAPTVSIVDKTPSPVPDTPPEETRTPAPTPENVSDTGL